ncbi:atypical chemokine receptor 1 [Coturnix japonica]|uniref:atypical chemokine receptor 1 n=1 Tax=Coturnix japonica TaxID=93934 RepID=UPI0007778D44|nr:atypical chemokine receptor 1 [Coturnix japonica]
MGNCIPGSPGIIGNRTSLLLLDYNYSDYVDYMDNNTDINQDMGINQEDFAAAAPCHNRYCPFFHRAAPPYLIATSVTSLMATAALLLALSLRPKAWPRGRMLVAQLAACCGLFAITLLPMAAGIAWGWQMGEGPCKVALLLWHGSVLAQGLLLGVGCCNVWAHGWCLAVVLWVTAMGMAVPAALSGGIMGTGLSTQCVHRNVDVDSVVHLLQLTVYCCILLLLPGALLMTAVLRGMWGAMGQKVGWMFWVLWAPHGVVMVVEVLLEVGVIPTSCGAFESFDFALGLSAALGGLHCCLMPLMLLLTAFYGHKVGGEC